MRSGPPPGEEKKRSAASQLTLGSPIADPASMAGEHSILRAGCMSRDLCRPKRTASSFTVTEVTVRESWLAGCRLLLWDSGIAVLVLARKF